MLAVDVGNTRTKFGWFPTEHPLSADLPLCERFLAVPHGTEIPWATLQAWADAPPCLIAVAGSHPGRIADLQAAFYRQGWAEVWTLADRQAITLTIDVDAPDKVGMDRLLNAVAANTLRPGGRAAIIMDTGTAATVDFLSADGQFCGGAILPGFALSAQALHHYTALLPLLTVRELANDPPVAVGRHTADAIRSGVYWGHVGALKEVVTRICEQHGLPFPDWQRPDFGGESPWLLLTGGGAPFLEPVFPHVRQVPSLALSGLVLVARQVAR